MYILYVYRNGAWQAYATFKDRRGYATQVQQAVALKSTSDNVEQRNSAIVMQAFVLGKNYYDKAQGKTVMRALRHFDEVGLSNDIFEQLDSALNEEIEAFALLKEGENTASYVQGEIAVGI